MTFIIRFGLIFVLLLVGCENTRKQDANCKPIRLDSPGKAFEKIPAYNQRSAIYENQSIDFRLRATRSVKSEFCYAIAASQLIDFYRFSNGDDLKMITSPLSIALNYKSLPYKELIDIERNDILGPGNALSAIQKNRNKIVCDQRWLESKAAFFTATVPSINNSLMHYSYNLLNRENYFSQKDLDGHEMIKRLGELSSAVCKDHSFKINFPEIKAYRGTEGDTENKILNLQAKTNIRKRINSILVEKEKPVAATICYSDAFGEQGKPCVEHISMIIGQRKKNDSCEFLIRDGYSHENCQRPGLECDKGSIWVNDNKFLKSNYEILYFD